MRPASLAGIRIRKRVQLPDNSLLVPKEAGKDSTKPVPGYERVFHITNQATVSAVKNGRISQIVGGGRTRAGTIAG